MNLPESDQRPRTAILRRRELLEECRAIALDFLPGIFLGKTEIECVLTVNLGNAVTARAEPMNQPGNACERIGIEDSKLGILDSGGGHGNILAT